MSDFISGFFSWGKKEKKEKKEKDIPLIIRKFRKPDIKQEEE
tara:strand:- start:215 stop:340 length:126 start_codon:yes stop_codon:yes gene_type:complete